MDAAAIAFNNRYWADAQSRTTFTLYGSLRYSRERRSIVIAFADGREAGAFIHRRGGYYVLGNTFWGTHEFVGPGIVLEVNDILRAPIVGMVHTHPDSIYVGGDVFSPADMWLGNTFNISVYAVTRGGIIRHDPGATSNAGVTIYTRQP